MDFHFFAICVRRIEYFLPRAARAAGYKIPAADRDLLVPYRRLRDYYEHMEDRLPGGKNYDKAVSEWEQSGKWKIKAGVALDAQGRIIVDGVVVDVTSDGLANVREVLRRNWEQLRPSTIELVRKHFERDPSNIPDPRDVRRCLLASIGEPEQ